MESPLLVLVIFFLIFQVQETAWARIHIKLANDTHIITAGHKTAVLWTRNTTDPTYFLVAQMKHGEKTASQSNPVQAKESQTEGNLSVVFKESGKFHLIALNRHVESESNSDKIHINGNSTLFKSQELNVSNPTSGAATSSVPSASSTTHPSGSEPSTATILAVCLGTVLVAVVALFVVYLILRRRHRKSSTKISDDQYVFSLPSHSNPYSTSPQPSRSWLIRKFWKNPSARASSITLQNSTNNVDGSGWPDSLNFYHTPRAPPRAFVKNSSPSRAAGGTEVSNHTETSLSSMRFSQKTERQMELEERIQELTGKLDLLQKTIRVPETRPNSRTLINMTHNMRIGKWRGQIEKLQELMGSEWALGRTDVIPKGLGYNPELSAF
ncbi:hypothetical protein C8R42DRAFT_232463 [Lentinula raphanica]|nr:hypothetical protein C8R42DRAFT_232463 [Lentinula raphanica]